MNNASIELTHIINGTINDQHAITGTISDQKSISCTLSIPTTVNYQVINYDDLSQDDDEFTTQDDNN